MDLNFAEAIRALDPNEVTRLANQPINPQSYLFRALLPERVLTDYNAKTSTMTVRSTMAGMVPMDSPYPEGGAIEMGDFNEQTAKLATATTVPEGAIREIQGLIARMRLGDVSGNPIAVLQGTALNFLEKFVIQPLDDTREYLRGKAIMTGMLNWTFGKVTLNVDYQIPAGNRFALRTGTAHYGGTASAFTTDMRAARKILKGNVRGAILHPDTLDLIVDNEVNRLVVVNEAMSGDGLIRTVTLRRAVRNAEGITVGFDQDSRGTYTFTAYAREGEVLDVANPGRTIKVPMVPAGVIALVGNNAGTPLVVGAGSTPPVENALGYYHVAPTVEGNNVPGRFVRLFTPENRPWSARAEGAENSLPVLEAPEKVVLLQTAMA